MKQQPQQTAATAKLYGLKYRVELTITPRVLSTGIAIGKTKTVFSTEFSAHDPVQANETGKSLLTEFLNRYENKYILELPRLWTNATIYLPISDFDSEPMPITYSRAEAGPVTYYVPIIDRSHKRPNP